MFSQVSLPQANPFIYNKPPPLLYLGADMAFLLVLFFYSIISAQPAGGGDLFMPPQYNRKWFEANPVFPWYCCYVAEAGLDTAASFQPHPADRWDDKRKQPQLRLTRYLIQGRAFKLIFLEASKSERLRQYIRTNYIAIL